MNGPGDAPDDRDVPATKADLDMLYRRVEAVTGLYAVLRPTAPLPPLGDWAVDPLLAVLLVDTVIDERPLRIAECGSGTSTVLMAATLRHLGLDAARIVSFEHDPLYVDISRTWLRRHGLDDRATVLHAPLVDGPHGVWYDTAVVDAHVPAPIDLLFVDGPPASTGGPLARGAALPALHDRLAQDACVVVDDAARPGEQEFLSKWQERYAEIAFTFHWTQTGAAVGRRSR